MKQLAYADQIKELARRQPEVTLRELAHRLHHAHSGQTLSRALRALA